MRTKGSRLDTYLSVRPVFKYIKRVHVEEKRAGIGSTTTTTTTEAGWPWLCRLSRQLSVYFESCVTQFRCTRRKRSNRRRRGKLCTNLPHRIFASTMHRQQAVRTKIAITRGGGEELDISSHRLKMTIPCGERVRDWRLYLDDDYTARNLYRRRTSRFIKISERFSIPRVWPYREILIHASRPLGDFSLATGIYSSKTIRYYIASIDILSFTVTFPTYSKIGGKKLARSLDGKRTNGTLVSKVWRDKGRIDRE